jgi:hypothetical protein
MRTSTAPAQSAGGFFIEKAHEAEERAANAKDETERATWLEIANEYRRLAEVDAQVNARR